MLRGADDQVREAQNVRAQPTSPAEELTNEACPCSLPSTLRAAPAGLRCALSLLYVIPTVNVYTIYSQRSLAAGAGRWDPGSTLHTLWSLQLLPYDLDLS